MHKKFAFATEIELLSKLARVEGCANTGEKPPHELLATDVDCVVAR